MKQFKFKINGNDYSVDINDFDDDICKLEVNGTPYEVVVEKKVKTTSKTPRIIARPAKPTPEPNIEKREGGEAHPITAPLPGNIFEVKVKEGDIIEKGQVLLIMEAMKMENQVMADRKGVVEKIMVQPGDAVLQGDLLLKLI